MTRKEKINTIKEELNAEVERRLAEKGRTQGEGFGETLDSYKLAELCDMFEAEEENGIDPIRNKAYDELSYKYSIFINTEMF